MKLSNPHGRPPVGLMSEKAYEEAVNAERIRSIVAAIGRYQAEDYPIPPCWTEELERRQARLPRQPGRLIPLHPST